MVVCARVPPDCKRKGWQLKPSKKGLPEKLSGRRTTKISVISPATNNVNRSFPSHPLVN